MRLRLRRLPAAQSQDPLGKTTLDQRIVADAAPEFRNLTVGPGEPYITREAKIGKAEGGRAKRRSSMLYFGQLSDFQLADEESPARVEFIDTGPFSAAWRPWEAMNPQIDDAMIRQLNALRRRRARSPPATARAGRWTSRSTPATSPTASS